MLSKRKPRLTWAPGPFGKDHIVARLMLGPWQLSQIISQGDYGYTPQMSLPITADANGRVTVPRTMQLRPTVEQAKELAEKHTLAFLKAVGLDPVVAFPDKTVRAPKPPLALTGNRRLDL